MYLYFLQIFPPMPNTIGNSIRPPSFPPTLSTSSTLNTTQTNAGIFPPSSFSNTKTNPIQSVATSHPALTPPSSNFYNTNGNAAHTPPLSNPPPPTNIYNALPVRYLFNHFVYIVSNSSRIHKHQSVQCIHHLHHFIILQ